MGTGIVSIALSLAGQQTVSRILLVLTAAIWVILAVLLAARAAHDHARFVGDRRTPAALTSVAGTAVLGTAVLGARLTGPGWEAVGVGLLVSASLTWAAALVPVLAHWRTPTVGVSLMLTVSTEALAVLAATLAVSGHARWLLGAALAPFVLGLAFYVFVIARFDLRQLEVGRGDHWITGGALAISTLAAAKITTGAKALTMLGSGGGATRDLVVCLWVLTMAWLPVLLLTEALRPRVRYGVQRWSTVFPVGMYAACSFAVGAAVGACAITRFARVWAWVALGMWLIVFAAMLGRGVKVLRG